MNAPMLSASPVDRLAQFEHSLPAPPDTFFEDSAMTYRLGQDVHRLRVLTPPPSRAKVQCDQGTQILSLTIGRQNGLVAYQISSSVVIVSNPKVDEKSQKNESILDLG